MDTKKLIEYAKSNNIIIGICDNKPLEYIRPFINKEIPFVDKDIENRIDPKNSFIDTKSIIVVGVPYGKNYAFQMDNTPRGKISMSAIGLDYHKEVRAKIQDLLNYINKRIFVNYKIFVDTGSLVERELAKKSGIGFQGKNCSVISNEFGSLFFIGYALVDYKFEPTKKNSFDYSLCGNCTACQKACPTNALAQNFVCHWEKCVSYLTQKKDDIDEGLRKSMDNSIYGCDICQLVCPYNKDKFIQVIDDINIPMPTIEFLKSLSNSQFKKQFGHTGIFWRGKKTIMRNVSIAEDNYNIDV